MTARALAAALLLLALGGCRDAPSEVIDKAMEAAARGDLSAVQGSFSVATVQRLERAWRLDNVRPGVGWERLSERLLSDGKPLEVVDEAIHEEYARVIADTGVEKRDYYLRKEDGRWRIELGAGMRFRQLEKAARPPDEAAEKGEETPDDR